MVNYGSVVSSVFRAFDGIKGCRCIEDRQNWIRVDTGKDGDRQSSTAVQSEGGLIYKNNKKDYLMDELYDKTYDES